MKKTKSFICFEMLEEGLGLGSTKQQRLETYEIMKLKSKNAYTLKQWA